MEEIFVLIGFVVAIIMIVAQCKLFTVAITRIRELLEFTAVQKGIIRDPKLEAIEEIHTGDSEDLG